MHEIQYSGRKLANTALYLMIPMYKGAFFSKSLPDDAVIFATLCQG